MGTAMEQGEIWGARATDWQTCNEPAWTGVFNAVLDAAGAGAGRAHLDLGCGSGGALVLAKQRGARVAGIDASTALAAVARERLPEAEIAVGDMEDLPFAGGSFETVSAINSLQFVGDPGRAMREAARVCCDGGTVTVLVWGPPAASDLLSGIMPAVFALLPQQPATTARPPQLGEPGKLKALMEDAGLKQPVARDFPSELRFPDLATGVRACLSASARAIRHAGEDTVRKAIEKAMVRFVTGNGDVRLRNSFHMVTARH